MGFGHNTIPFIDTLYTSAITAPLYFQSGMQFFNYICRQEEKVEEKAKGEGVRGRRGEGGSGGGGVIAGGERESCILTWRTRVLLVTRSMGLYSRAAIRKHRVLSQNR